MSIKTRQYLSIVLGLIILLGGWWYFKSKPAKEAVEVPVVEKLVEQKAAKGLAVESPKQNEKVTFPLTVKGNITGEEGWIAYEGQTGTVQLFDAGDQAVGSVLPLVATADWMQPVVPFEIVLGNATTTSFVTTATGYLLFTAENPSGEGVAPTYKLSIKF